VPPGGGVRTGGHFWAAGCRWKRLAQITLNRLSVVLANKLHPVRPRDWHEGVKESIERARRDQERIKEERDYPSEAGIH
jgi:hypothetical protein